MLFLPKTGRNRPYMRKNREFIKKTYDFIVVGGGMTGVCAALAAARNGASVALVQERPVLGGNASSEVRLHVCGASANMVKPDLTEGGILHELMLSNKRLNDSYCFSIWDGVLFQALKQEKNLTLYLNTTMIDVYAKDHRVHAVECYQMTTEKRFLLSARFFADCTGNGTLCAFAGAEYRTGREPQSEFGEPHAPDTWTNERMGNTLLFKAIDKGHPVPFIPPVDIIHFTEEQLKYRKHCAAVPEELKNTLSPEEIERLYGGFAPDYGYWWIEIPGEGENIIEEYEEIRDQLVSAIYGVWDHIKNGGDHGAENYELAWVGMLPGTRESRRMECDYMLTENDILDGRSFPDKVAYGGWPIDDNRFGLFAFDTVPAITYALPDSYDIPYRSYCVKDFENLYVGGRCMGVSRLALASTRVMGTCAIGGQAIGTAAALLSQTDAMNIRAIDMARLQQTLLRDDCYLPAITNQDPTDLALDAAISASGQLPGYSASSITNGITRKLGTQNNQWRTEADPKNPPWIRLDFKHQILARTIRITFDSNFNIEKKMTMSSRRQKQQVVGVPRELVRDYELTLFQDGQAVATRQIQGNFQRVNQIVFPGVACDALQLTVLSTNGDPFVRVFEMRVYED